MQYVIENDLDPLADALQSLIQGPTGTTTHPDRDGIPARQIEPNLMDRERRSQPSQKPTV